MIHNVAFYMHFQKDKISVIYSIFKIGILLCFLTTPSIPIYAIKHTNQDILLLAVSTTNTNENKTPAEKISDPITDYQENLQDPEDDESISEEDQKFNTQLYVDPAKLKLFRAAFSHVHSYQNMAFIWAGNQRYQSTMGIGGALQLSDYNLWIDMALGYSKDNASYERLEFKYKRETRYLSLYARIPYYVKRLIPINIHAELGIHRLSHNIQNAYVFSEDITDKQATTPSISGSIKFGLSLYSVIFSNYYVSSDLISLVYHTPLTNIDTGIHKSIDTHIHDTLQRITFTPPFNIQIGYLF